MKLIEHEFKHQFKYFNLIVKLRSWEMKNSQIFNIDEIILQKIDIGAQRRNSLIENGKMCDEQLESINCKS